MSRTSILLESGTNEVEIVEFFLNETTPDGEAYTGYYGMNVAKVLEIIRMPDVTSLPEKSHPSVMGAFNLRDRVIPLVNLSMWLGKNMAEIDAPKVIVTEFSQVQTAFLVSGVTRIHRLSWEDIELPDQNVQRYSGENITGVVNLEGRVVFILDMEKIVADINPKLAIRMEEEAAQEIESQEQGERFKALIADDSTSIRHMVARSLEKAGFEVTRTINGRMALETLQGWKAEAEAQGRSITDYVDIVVSDIEMPGMDGHNLTRKIKEDPVLKNIPVILFSSLITEALKHKGKAVGADDQISKPDLPLLTQKAKDLIAEYQAGE